MIVKSNSFPVTKSIAFDAERLPAGSTATRAPMNPAFRFGAASLSASRVLTSHANEIEVACERHDVRQLVAMRRRVDKLAAFDQRRGLREPVRIPERPDLAPRLEARPRAAVESVERRPLQEKRSHHPFRSSILFRVPLAEIR